MHAGHLLLLLLAVGVRGDAGCTDGTITGGAQGAVGSTCECNAGYSGGGAVQNGGTGTATYTDCTACPPGQHQDQTGQTECKGTACAVGKFFAAAQTDTVTCTDCADDKFADQTGTETCKDCAVARRDQLRPGGCQGPGWPHRLYVRRSASGTRELLRREGGRSATSQPRDCYHDGSRAGVQTGLRATSGTELKVGVSEE